MADDSSVSRQLRDRAVTLTSLALVVGLSWLYLWREAQSMSAMPMGMSSAGSTSAWSVDSIVLTFLMWTVMMAGMMLPGAAPAILLYASVLRRNAARGVVLGAVWLFVAGYLAAWTTFSAVATGLQLSLREASWLSAGMASASVWLSSAILVVAGIYQWLPIKDVCLEKCRSPLGFFLSRWRPGHFGSLRMGWDHGWICVGCCWALMLVLFVAGVMNLLWVALIAGFVFVEKVLPASAVTTRGAGAGLVLSGLALPLIERF